MPGALILQGKKFSIFEQRASGDSKKLKQLTVLIQLKNPSLWGVVMY